MSFAVTIPPVEEHKRFNTYANYLKCVSELISAEYGSEPAERYGGVLNATQVLASKVGGRKVSDAERALASRNIRGAWGTLVTLAQQATSSDPVYELKNAWTPVQAWYAVHHGMCALTALLTDVTRFSHTLSTREAAKLIDTRSLMPYPWSAYVTTTWFEKDFRHRFNGFKTSPAAVSNLASPTTSTLEDHYAKLLTTTASQRCLQKIKDKRAEKSKNGRAGRISDAEKRPICEVAGSTTLFDFLYRLRVRANYGDVDTFVVGCPSALEARQFTRSLFRISDSTLAVIEALLLRYLGKKRVRGLLEQAYYRYGKASVLGMRIDAWS